MEKVRGKVFNSLFQEFRGEDKMFLVALISSAN